MRPATPGWPRWDACSHWWREMDVATLVLRDVHVPASPSFWPPAPGWWVVFAIFALSVAGIAAWGGIDILRDAHGEHHKAVHADDR